MRRIAVLALVAVLVPAALATEARAPDATPAATRPPGCTATYTRAHFRPAARKIMRSPVRLSRSRGRKLHRFIRCARTPAEASAMRRKLGEWRRWRRSYAGVWQLRFERLAPGWRGWAHGTAFCETGGKMNRNAYNGAGPFYSYFQWMLGTWYAQGGADRHPYSATYAHQAVLAVRLAIREGTSHWPTCG